MLRRVSHTHAHTYTHAHTHTRTPLVVRSLLHRGRRRRRSRSRVCVVGLCSLAGRAHPAPCTQHASVANMAERAPSVAAAAAAAAASRNDSAHSHAAAEAAAASPDSAGGSAAATGRLSKIRRKLIAAALMQRVRGATGVAGKPAASETDGGAPSATVAAPPAGPGPVGVLPAKAATANQPEAVAGSLRGSNDAADGTTTPRLGKTTSQSVIVQTARIVASAQASDGGGGSAGDEPGVMRDASVVPLDARYYTSAFDPTRHIFESYSDRVALDDVEVQRQRLEQALEVNNTRLSKLVLANHKSFVQEARTRHRGSCAYAVTPLRPLRSARRAYDTFRFPPWPSFMHGQPRAHRARAAAGACCGSAERFAARRRHMQERTATPARCRGEHDQG